jgi:hypothetical protein
MADGVNVADSFFAAAGLDHEAYISPFQLLMHP